MVVGANLVAQHEDVAVRKKDKYVELDVTVPTVKILNSLLHMMKSSELKGKYLLLYVIVNNIFFTIIYRVLTLEEDVDLIMKDVFGSDQVEFSDDDNVEEENYNSDNGNYSEDNSVCDSSDSENLEEL